MAWQLSPDVRCCVASDRVILLDIARDRYFQLPLRQSEAFQAWLDGDASAVLAFGEQLHRAGILVSADPPSQPIRTPIAAPRRALVQTGRIKPPLGAVSAAAASLWRVHRQLNRAGLMRTLEWVRPTVGESSEDDVPRLAARFLDARRRLPIAASCLPDSLALLDHLGRHGRSASIVFGVTGVPFHAHCWVQLGDQVLNDTLDHVSHFTPILAR